MFPLQLNVGNSRALLCQDYKNNTNGVLHNLQEEPMIEDIGGTLQIYASLDDEETIRILWLR